MDIKLSDYVRESELIPGMVPFSHATLWRLSKLGKFPKPIRLSDRITAWKRKDVMDWLHAKGVE